MASWAIFRRTAATATLLRNSLKSIAPAATRRPFCSSSSNSSSVGTVDVDVDSSTFVIRGPPQKYKVENPFQLSGTNDVVKVDEIKNATLVRIGLPGIGEKGIKVWTEDNTVFFAARGDSEYEGQPEDQVLKYGGSLEFSPDLHRADGFKAEMLNGILKLFIANAETVEKSDN